MIDVEAVVAQHIRDACYNPPLAMGSHGSWAWGLSRFGGVLRVEVRAS